LPGCRIFGAHGPITAGGRPSSRRASRGSGPGNAAAAHPQPAEPADRAAHPRVQSGSPGPSASVRSLRSAGAASSSVPTACGGCSGGTASAGASARSHSWPAIPHQPSPSVGCPRLATSPSTTLAIRAARPDRSWIHSAQRAGRAATMPRRMFGRWSFHSDDAGGLRRPTGRRIPTAGRGAAGALCLGTGASREPKRRPGMAQRAPNPTSP
jgi:hypothetical protein